MKTRLKREYFRRFLRPMNKLDLSPGLVGRTFGVGTAAGLSATVGLQSVIVLGLWAAFRPSMSLRFNLPIAWVLTGITNPLTLVPMYTFYYSVGVALLGKTDGAYDMSAYWLRLEEDGVFSVALDSWNFLLITLLGSLPFTVAGGVAAYYLGRWIGGKMANRRQVRFLRLEKLKAATRKASLPLSRRRRSTATEDGETENAAGTADAGTAGNAVSPDAAASEPAPTPRPPPTGTDGA